RQAVHIDPNRAQVVRDQACAEPCSPQPGLRISLVERAVMRARRILWPMRGAEPLHAPALLVDQDRGVAPDRLAHVVGERPELIRRLNIALEDDETKRVRVAEE